MSDNVYQYSQIQRVEEEDQIFALEISEAHVLELPIVDCCGFKSRSLLSDGCGPPGRAWQEKQHFTHKVAQVQQIISRV